MRGYASELIPEAIRRAGGEIYAVTSESQSLATRAEREWDFGFASIGDPHQEISQSCARRGWLELGVQRDLGFIEQAADFELGHPKGFFQPGVLAVTRAGRVLYRWRSIPSKANVGGATGRPSARYVWQRIEEALAEDSDAPDAKLDEAPELDTPPVSWPIFVASLVANGWFLRPRAFTQNRGSGDPLPRIRRALLRIPGFLAVWAVAFATLPTFRVSFVLAAWIAWIGPQVVDLGRRFNDAGPASAARS